MVNIYVIYKGGNVENVTTLPRIVQDEFRLGADRAEVWRKESRVKMFQSVRDFNRFINPRLGEDDETGGGDYEW